MKKTALFVLLAPVFMMVVFPVFCVASAVIVLPMYIFDLTYIASDLHERMKAPLYWWWDLST